MLRALFGIGPKVDVPQLLGSGAVVIDVRTRQEYAGGHVKGSKNIPLDELLNSLHSIAKGKPVITCCASGMRSNSAAGMLRDHGFDAHNGGPWTRVRSALTA